MPNTPDTSTGMLARAEMIAASQAETAVKAGMIATTQSVYKLQTEADARVALAFLAKTPWTELADLTEQQRQEGAQALQKLSAQQGFDGLQGHSEQEILEAINTLIDGNTK